MPSVGKLELTIKINEFPDAQTVENGWKQFLRFVSAQMKSLTD